MKKLVSFLAVFILLMNIAVPVFADNTTSAATTTSTVTTGSTVTTADTAGSAGVQLADPGILPDSPFYFFDKLFEKIILFFTFSPEKKAQELLEDANERLAEAQVMADDGKQDLAVQTSQAYLDTVQQAQVQIVIATGDGKVSGAVYNTVTSAVYGLKDRSIVAVVYGLDISQRHAAQVLLRILAKAPEQARKGLMNAFINVIKRQIDDEAAIYVTTDGRTVSLAVYNEDHHLKAVINSMGLQLWADGSKPEHKDKKDKQDGDEEHGKTANSGLNEAANAGNNDEMDAQSPAVQQEAGKKAEENAARNSEKNREKDQGKNQEKNREKNNSFKVFVPGDSTIQARGTVSAETGSWSSGNGDGDGKDKMQHGRQDGGDQDD